MFPIVDEPSAHRLASSMAIPARMSGLVSRSPKSFDGPATTTRCGSQTMIRAPMFTSLSTKKSRLSNIFSNTSTVPRACVATTTAIEVRSAGNAGRAPLDLDAHPEPVEGRPDRDEVARLDLLDRDLPAGDRAEPDEARHLDAVAADPVVAPAQRGAALD